MRFFLEFALAANWSIPVETAGYSARWKEFTRASMPIQRQGRHVRRQLADVRSSRTHGILFLDSASRAIRSRDSSRDCRRLDVAAIQPVFWSGSHSDNGCRAGTLGRILARSEMEPESKRHGMGPHIFLFTLLPLCMVMAASILDRHHDDDDGRCTT